MLVAAIDPGKSGGWAVFSTTRLIGDQLVRAGPIDFDDMTTLADQLTGVSEVLIERAQAAPKQGISTAFEYGRVFGRIEAVCQLTCNKIFYCAPAWWKGKLGVPADKKLAQTKALKVIPGLEKYVTLQKHNGIAEAALMAQILLDDRLFQELVDNNKKREAPKKKRPSFTL